MIVVFRIKGGFEAVGDIVGNPVGIINDHSLLGQGRVTDNGVTAYGQNHVGILRSAGSPLTEESVVLNMAEDQRLILEKINGTSICIGQAALLKQDTVKNHIHTLELTQ